jgi:hypothetical protein
MKHSCKTNKTLLNFSILFIVEYNEINIFYLNNAFERYVS